ncbi:predicted protein, partial [Nematostella vectensis]
QPVGLENRLIPDSRIKASSWLSDHPAYDGRLGNGNYWCAMSHDQDQWLEVDIGEKMMLLFVATQGNGRDAWVSSFYLQFSPDNMTWYCYGTEKNIALIRGNSDAGTVLYGSMFPSIYTRYLRLNPHTWVKDICLRLEIYGC